MVDRRTVMLAGGALALGGSGLVGGLAWAGAPAPSAGGFGRCLDDAFGVRGGDAGTVDLVLVAVSERPAARPIREQFSLLFRGPSAQALESGTYQLEHYASGRVYEMLLQATGAGSGSPQYRADFSLIGR